MKTLRILLISLLLFTTACSSLQTGAAETITVPSSWKLVSYGKAGAETPVVEGSTITLEFSDKVQIGGNGGCNSYGGKYTITGSSLKISDIVSTLMACADDKVTQQETQYFSALQSATGFKISGDNLIISYGDGQSQLTFVKQ